MQPTMLLTLHPVQPVSPKPCPTCRGGCRCDPSAGQSCGHYGCWGREATGDCPGVAYELARDEAQRAAFDALRRRETARRTSYAASYRRIVHSHLDRRP